MKGPANNWAPVTKPLLYALFRWHFRAPHSWAWVPVVGVLAGMLFAPPEVETPQISAQWPQPLLSVPWLMLTLIWLSRIWDAPRIPMALLPLLLCWNHQWKTPWSLKSDCPRERIIPSDTLFCLHVWTSSLGPACEPFPSGFKRCVTAYSWVSGPVRSCKTTVTDLGRSRQLCYLSSLPRRKFFR